MNTELSRLLAAALLLVATIASAAEFPSQPVRIVVPFAPGGGTDVVARLGREIGNIMRDPVVLERVSAAGLDPVTGTSAELGALVKRDIERYRRVIALTGAKPEER